MATHPHLALPMTRHEMEARGWTQCDIILVSGDAYIDHPSFGVALIGRHLEDQGYKVGIIAQPDHTRQDSIQILGKPRLFFGVSAGNVDSQLSHLTVMRKLRRDDPYSPGGTAGKRPPKATIVYCSMIKQAYNDVPVVIGGIEASLRRFAYFDYWSDKVRRSILFDSKADIIAYGMAERSVIEIATRLAKGVELSGIAGTCIIKSSSGLPDETFQLPSFEDVSGNSKAGHRAFADMARAIQERHLSEGGQIVAQKHADKFLVAYPPAAPLSTMEIDSIYGLPYTRKPHPSYGTARIPAYEMIKDSITVHRGCYADCAFCAITAHQGKRISSRSERNILDELTKIADLPEFKGTITDLGGPTANMYGTGCKLDRNGCKNRNCLHPAICSNLDTSHARYMELLDAASALKRIKHIFISSGIRFDLALQAGNGSFIDRLAKLHTSGLLKIAPEHVCDSVLAIMKKPSERYYRSFVSKFLESARRHGKRLGVVEYFMSGHPGCTLKDMVEMAVYLHKNRIAPEQVQDFYPAPMTIACAMYYTGLDPFTMSNIYTARSDREKALQRALLLHHKPEFHRKAKEALMEAGRSDLIGNNPDCLIRNH